MGCVKPSAFPVHCGQLRRRVALSGERPLVQLHLDSTTHSLVLLCLTLMRHRLCKGKETITHIAEFAIADQRVKDRAGRATADHVNSAVNALGVNRALWVEFD